jgi:hydrogenase expression/formation protein HypC
MCIGVPMQVTEAGPWSARCEDGEGRSELVDTALIGATSPGDWLLVHKGIAMRALDPTEAALIRDALAGAALAAAGGSFEHLFADLINRTPELPPHLRPPTNH